MRRIMLAVIVSGSVAAAQTPPKTQPLPPCKKSVKQPCEKTIDMTPLPVDGRVRELSMLGFLERATEELERASLEKISFVPKLLRTVDEAAF